MTEADLNINSCLTPPARNEYVPRRRLRRSTRFDLTLFEIDFCHEGSIIGNKPQSYSDDNISSSSNSSSSEHSSSRRLHHLAWRLKDGKHTASSKAKQLKKTVMAASGAGPYLAKKAREMSGDQAGDKEEWELDGIRVPGVLITGTELTKISEKKGIAPKRRLFRLDADQGRILWDSKRRGMINIENIKELRLGPDAHSEIALLLPVKSATDIEDRWLTIIYTIEESYKTLHVIAPTADLLRQWYDTLSRLRQLRLEYMAGVFHSTMQSSEVWNRHHFAGADKSGDKRLDFQEVKSLCRRLNFGGKESEIRRKFDEADKAGNKSLSYDEFRDFVAKLKERPELNAIFKEIKGDGEFTFSIFESFMKNTQKSELSSPELESIYQEFLPVASPETSSNKVQQSISWTIGSFTAFLMSGYNSAFADYVTPPPSSHNPAVSPTTRTSNIYQNMTLPLSSYFICCSHNTYLVGNQLVGTSSVEGYVRALLGGCRSVEMDIYDGPESGLAHHFAITMSNTISTDVGELTEGIEEAVGAAAEVVESGAFLGSTANDGLTPEQRGATANYKGIIPGEPIVTHGGTLTSSLSVRRICEAIERYAFVASPYPVIISGELHCGIPQQKVLVKVMREVFGDKLVVAPVDSDDADIILPSPEALKGRILFKAKNKLLEVQSKARLDEEEVDEEEAEGKKVASKGEGESWKHKVEKMFRFGHRDKSTERPKDAKSEHYSSAEKKEDKAPVQSTLATVQRHDPAAALVPAPSAIAVTSQPSPRLHVKTVPSLDDETKQSLQTPSTSANTTPVGKHLMAPELLPLLVYTSGVTYRGLSPNAGYAPSQVFSLSENRAKSLIHNPKQVGIKDSLKTSAKDSALLVEHTREHLVRVYPKGSRVDSSNYEPNVFWAVGCQLVAQNWQTVDCGWHLNRAMYLRNGGAGYIMKPPALLDPSYPFDHKQHRRTKHLLHIKVISAQQLPRPKDTQGHEIIDKNTVDPYVKVAIHIPIWASGQTSESIAPISVAPIVTQQSTDKHAPAPGKVTSKSSTQEAVLAEAGPAGEEEVGAAVGEREVKVKTKMIPNNGFNPLWNEKLTLPFDVFGEGMNDLIFVRFLVKDSNMEKDDFVGGYCTSLGSLEMGYRHLPLYDEQVSQILFASLFVHISIEDL